MSDLAVAENNFVWRTASEFHDDFILNEIKHENFSCPFCEIRLVAKAIYIHEPQAKSPHFSCFPHKHHLNGCDGYPLVNGKSIESTSHNKKIKIGKKEFQFPEKLTARRNNTTTIERNLIDKEETSLNEIEIVRRRRERAGKEVGEAKYTTSLVRSFAKAYKKVLKLCYEKAKKKQFTKEQRQEFINKKLKEIPIDLGDNSEVNDYQAAFKGTKYFYYNMRIWNGEGSVSINAEKNIIRIQSSQDCQPTKEEVPVPFNIFIKIPKDIENRPAYDRDTISKLISAADNMDEIRWFVCGSAEIAESRKNIRLIVEDPKHIFFKKENKKIITKPKK